MLNSEQRAAVEHGNGPLMVLAGAGSGKTRVLVHRIAMLVERGVDPARILAVTFTNKAAGEMRDRLESIFGVSARAMWISTFHSSCARLLRRHHEAAGLSRDFAIYDDDDQKKILNQLIKQEQLEEVTTPRGVAVLIDRAKNRGEDPVEAYVGSHCDDIIRTLYPLYRDRLQREDAVDFNDLLLKVLELGSEPETGRDLRTMFDYVLVDEFQDTNVVQFALVKMFCELTDNLTVVGDDDQSIYSWRGAEPRNLLDFSRSFPKAKSVRLEQNYRSTQVILDAANGVIENNADRHVKALWTERSGGEQIVWEEASDERREAEFVASVIPVICSEESREWGDFAILYRTHAQSRVLEETLRAHGIDYRIVGGVSFFQRKEVKDIRGYLRLALNSAADLAFERIVNVPARGIGKTTLDRLRTFARRNDMSYVDAARAASRGQVQSLRPAAGRKLAQFVDIIDGLTKVVADGASVAEIIIQAVERSGYAGHLEQLDTPEASDRLQNLGELVNMATDFDDDTDGEGDLAAFEERISLAAVADQPDGRGTTVTMMTIHAAKGLEFPVVFVCGLEDGLFPSLREREVDREKALEEERRLAYVAFTRAEERLILTSARTRRHFGEVKMNDPSRFIDEIPSRCVQVREKSRAPVPFARRGSRHRFDPYSQDGPEDSFDQSSSYEDDIPDFDVGTDSATLGRGARVAHPSFGQGKVLEARGSGADAKLLIQFESVGLKTVLARYVDPA